MSEAVSLPGAAEARLCTACLCYGPSVDNDGLCTACTQDLAMEYVPDA